MKLETRRKVGATGAFILSSCVLVGILVLPLGDFKYDTTFKVSIRTEFVPRRSRKLQPNMNNFANNKKPIRENQMSTAEQIFENLKTQRQSPVAEHQKQTAKMPSRNHAIQDVRTTRVTTNYKRPKTTQGRKTQALFNRIRECGKSRHECSITNVPEFTCDSCCSNRNVSADLWNVDGGRTQCRPDSDGWFTWFRRVDASLKFDRTWDEYKYGFGHPDGNYWLGLEMLHKITSAIPVKLRVVLKSWAGVKRWGEYARFQVADEEKKYRAKTGYYNGTLVHKGGYDYSLSYAFSTKDKPNPGLNCPHRYGGNGGWWYYVCGHSFPTAVFPPDETKSSFPYMMWFGAFNGPVKHSIRGVEMKLKMIKGDLN